MISSSIQDLNEDNLWEGSTSSTISVHNKSKKLSENTTKSSSTDKKVSVGFASYQNYKNGREKIEPIKLHKPMPHSFLIDEEEEDDDEETHKKKRNRSNSLPVRYHQIPTLKQPSPLSNNTPSSPEPSCMQHSITNSITNTNTMESFQYVDEIDKDSPKMYSMSAPVKPNLKLNMNKINVHKLMLARSNRARIITPDENTISKNSPPSALSQCDPSMVYREGKYRKRSSSLPLLPSIRTETSHSKRILAYIKKTDHLKHLLVESKRVNLDNMEDAFLFGSGSPRDRIRLKIAQSPPSFH